MLKYIFVFFLGVTAATVGFSGMAKMLDNSVAKTQVIIKDQVKE
jgi:uncharacterized membrane protein YtjA (UPF0391 family)